MSGMQAALARFSQAVESVFDRDRPDGWMLCEEAFREILKPEFVRGVLEEAMQGLQAAPYSRGDWTPNQMILKRGPSYALALARYDQTSRYIHSSPYLAMYAPVGHQHLQVKRYRLPASYQNAVFNPESRLEFVEEQRFEPNEVLHVHPDGDVYHFQVEEPQLIFKFTSSAWHVNEWLFDTNTLKAIQANDAALVTTQLRVAAYLLGRIGDPSSVAPLRKLAEHNTPNVRWAAIQNLAKLDAAAARDRLEACLDDPHPHLRRAAAKSLRSIKDARSA